MIKEFAREYFNTLKTTWDSLSLDALEKFSDHLREAYDEDRQIFVFGNGGSAVTASHFTCDLNKDVSQGLQKRFKVICLNDNIPTLLAYANDNAYENIFVEQLKNFIREKDLVIGISASGNSNNVIKAIKFANEFGAETFGLTGFSGGELVKTAKTSLVVPVNDMQKIEDTHLVIIHVIVQAFRKSLRD